MVDFLSGHGGSRTRNYYHLTQKELFDIKYDEYTEQLSFEFIEPDNINVHIAPFPSRSEVKPFRESTKTLQPQPTKKTSYETAYWDYINAKDPYSAAEALSKMLDKVTEYQEPNKDMTSWVEEPIVKKVDTRITRLNIYNWVVIPLISSGITAFLADLAYHWIWF